MADDEEKIPNKEFMMLGFLDVQKIPCARESILFGAGCGLAGGLLFFLSTSRVRRSFDVGFGGFMLTTLAMWFDCRLQNAKLRMQQKFVQEGLKNKVAYEGTVRDPTNKPNPPSGPS